MIPIVNMHVFLYVNKGVKGLKKNPELYLRLNHRDNTSCPSAQTCSRANTDCQWHVGQNLDDK